MLIWNSDPAFKLLSSGVLLGRSKASGCSFNLTLDMGTPIWQPKLNSWDYQNTCVHIFHFCWHMTTLLTPETDCQPDLTEIWRFRIAEALWQEAMPVGIEMHSQKEKPQDGPSVCFTETSYRQRGGDHFQASRKCQSILRNKPSWEVEWDLLSRFKQTHKLSCILHSTQEYSCITRCITIYIYWMQ